MTDEENIELTTAEIMDDTDINIEDETIKVIETPVYEFTITERIDPNYGTTTQIIEWLQTNMESFLDDYNKPLFGKVNTGFNDSTLKTFGKRPVCDVYINNVDYGTDFDAHTPVKVHTIVIFYLKGANNNTYLKACQIHDLVMQEFLTNTDFQRLDDVVKETYIDNSSVSNRSIRGGFGVMGTFELTHTLYI